MFSSWWVADYLQAGQHVLLISWIFWVILSITLHELGHGVVAVWQGDRTPIETGHMTMNPLVHMGGMSLLVFALIGIAWGTMPVNPIRFRNGRYGDILVSAAGPAVNVALALIALTGFSIALQYAPRDGSFVENILTFLWIGGMLNVVLLILNLLPIPPLDGSRILAGLIPALGRYYARDDIARFAMFGVLAVLFFGGRYLFPAAEFIASEWTALVGAILP